MYLFIKYICSAFQRIVQLQYSVVCLAESYNYAFKLQTKVLHIQLK